MTPRAVGTTELGLAAAVGAVLEAVVRGMETAVGRARLHALEPGLMVWAVLAPTAAFSPVAEGWQRQQRSPW